MSDSSNEEDIPWSGFIDILSSVIMVFIFFVMLTVIVISQSMKKKKMADNKTLEEVHYTQNRTEKTIEQKTIFDDVKYQFYVLYDDIGITLLENTQKNINQYFDFKPLTDTPVIDDATKITSTFNKDKIVSITSYTPLYLDSAQKQEIALYRAFNVRNYLLKNGIDQKNIKIKIHTKTEEDKLLHEECTQSALGCVVISYEK
jgi:outer membrane protein OmpA-like peptidoglycan-associated protein